MRIQSGFLILIFSLILVRSTSAQGEDTAYTRVITDRAQKIAVTLGLKKKDEQKATGIITDQYRHLNAVHEQYKAAVAALKQQYGTDKEGLNAAVKKEEAQRDSLLKVQHSAYLKQLGKIMNAGQVEQVKNGMTYNLVNVTYDAYVDMIPSLKEEERQKIRGWLVEARELAMDAESSDKKHAVFGKYKGRINNYISAQGYDAQKERADWEARLKAKKNTPASSN